MTLPLVLLAGFHKKRTSTTATKNSNENSVISIETYQRKLVGALKKIKKERRKRTTITISRIIGMKVGWFIKQDGQLVPIRAISERGIRAII